MLSVAKVHWGGELYYLSAAAGRGDGLPAFVEPLGVWTGSLAEALGLAARVVEPVSMRALLAGADPETGEILDSRHHRVRIIGFDCTFAAPKSVSLLHALGTPEIARTVQFAHSTSVDAVLSYLERHAARVRRRSRGGDEVRQATGFCT
ncbi:MAG: conjugative relaxase domain protein, partial [Acidimicrobiaceae bacterium]|nr:conjugative relaxase domain protein [Acidimicrobiaceae bacterium]